MLEILAAGTVETIATGVGLPVAGGLGLWVLQKILSFKRLHAEIDLGGNGSGNEKKTNCPPAAECPKHGDFVKLVDDRHSTMTKSMDRIESRMDKNFGVVFTKLDNLKDQLLGGKGP